MSSTKNVVAMLIDQHRHIEKLLDEVRESHGAQRRAVFDELRRMLDAHEAAEGAITHPAARESGGEDVVDQRLVEEQEAKKIMEILNDLDVDSGEFERQFDVFRLAVMEHAEREEDQEFPLLLKALDEDELTEMAVALKDEERG